MSCNVSLDKYKRVVVSMPSASSSSTREIQNLKRKAPSSVVSNQAVPSTSGQLKEVVDKTLLNNENHHQVNKSQNKSTLKKRKITKQKQYGEVIRKGSIEEITKVLGKIRDFEINKQSSNDKSTLLQQVILDGRIDVALLLVNHRALIHLQDRHGRTPLNIAFLKKEVDLVRAMIETCQDGVWYFNFIGFNPLYRACELGWDDIVSLIMIKGSNLNADGNGNSPLFAALKNGNKECARLLIEAGANLDIVDENGFTPLHIACMNGWSDISVLLIENGLLLENNNNIDNLSPLMCALNKGYSECAQILIGRGARTDVIDHLGWSTLHFACYQNWMDIVELCLIPGVNLDVPDGQGKTPLLIAIESGNEKIAKVLIRNEANVNHGDIEGFTPLHYACHRNMVELIDLLIMKKANLNNRELRDGNTPLLVAVKLGHLECAESLIDANADANLADNSGYTALHVTCAHFIGSIFELLIKCNVQINVQTTNGLTPLMITEQTGNEAFKRALLEAEAGKFQNDIALGDITPLHEAVVAGDINKVIRILKEENSIEATDHNGKTALHYASERGNVDIVSLLMTHNANPDILDDNGETALHLAFKEEQRGCVKFFIGNRTNLTIRNEEGFLPIHMALELGWEDVVKTLIMKGVDLEDKNNEQQLSPLFVAFNSRNKKCVELLINNNVGLDVRDSDGFTPIYFASINGWLDIVRLIVGKNTYLNDKNNVRNINELFVALHRGHNECLKVLAEKVGLDVFCDEHNNTLLHLACNLGRHDIVEWLVKSGAMLDMQNNKGNTPLIMALEAGNSKCAELLIRNGASVTQFNTEAMTPLHIACRKNMIDSVCILVRKGAMSNDNNSHGFNPLHEAILSGSRECAEFLIKNKADINAEAASGRTAVNMACELGFLDIIKLLSANGADLDALDENDKSPLMITIENEYEECSLFLLSKRINVNFIDRNKYTALHYACSIGSKNVVARLIRKKAILDHNSNDRKETPLLVALSNGNMDCAKLLVEAGASLSKTTREGLSPLQLACYKGSHEMVSPLISKGCSANSGHKNIKPLICAIKGGHIECVRVLMQNGVDLNSRDEKGGTPLMMALLQGKLDIAEALIEGMANINLANDFQITALHIACWYGYENIVLLLIEKNAILDIPDYESHTPLQYCSTRGHEGCERLLLRKLDLPGSYQSGPQRSVLRHIDPSRYNEVLSLIASDDEQDGEYSDDGQGNIEEYLA